MKVTSDYEMQRVLAAALSKPGLPAPAVAQGLVAAKGIDSDYELARLLMTVAKFQTLDKTTRAPFFARSGWSNRITSIGACWPR